MDAPTRNLVAHHDTRIKMKQPVRRSKLILLVLFACSLPVGAASGQAGSEDEINSLKGLQGFYIAVDLVGPDDLLEAHGVDVRILHELVWNQTRDAQLPAKTRQQMEDQGRTTHLYVHVNTFESERGIYPFTIDIGLYQEVTPVRMPSVKLMAQTWKSSAMGLVSPDRFPLINEEIVYLIDEFIDAYRAAHIQ